jgi:hypothetical protein
MKKKGGRGRRWAYDPAMPEAQNFKNHGRIDPLYHYFLLGMLMTNLILSIYITIRDWPIHSRSHLWWIAMSVTFMVWAFKTRTYPLSVQDRVIRLEERLRMATLLGPGDLARSQALTTAQLVALRFAPDEELPGLVNRALSENLAPKQIKESITGWRADNTRV